MNQQEESYDQAMQAAMAMLKRRDLSCRELSAKLGGKRFGQRVIHQVIARLQDLAFLDDKSLGIDVMNQLQSRKPTGPHLLKAKLIGRGIDPTLVDHLIDTAKTNIDQVQQARALAQDRITRMKITNPQHIRKKLWGTLARRGFESDTIESALNELDVCDEG